MIEEIGLETVETGKTEVKRKKSKKHMGIIVLICFCAIIAGIVIYFNNDSVSARAEIKKHWNFALPISTTLEYIEDTGRALDDERFRYQVFSYKTQSAEKKISELAQWQAGEKQTGLTEVMTVVEKLPIDIDMLPDFNAEYKVAAFSRPDKSIIYMIFSTKKQKIYIAEYFTK